VSKRIKDLYSHVSRDEALAVLREIKSNPQSLNPNNSPVTAAMIERTREDYTELLHLYDTGKLQYQGPSITSQASNPQSSTEPKKVVTSTQTEAVYPTRKPKIPQELSKKADLSVEISKMDPHALTQEIPLGSISPSMKGVFFIDEEMRTPMPG